MIYKSYEPGRNAPCLCGSGRKFKQCCAHGYATERPVGAAYDALVAGDAQHALEVARWDLTRYVIWHRAHTVPWVERDPEAAEHIFDVDLNALGEMVDRLRECYVAAGIGTTFPEVLARLRGHFDYPRWRQRLLAQQAIAAMGDEWSDEVARKEIGVVPDLGTLEDFEFAAMVLHVYGDELGLAEQLTLTDQLIDLARSRVEQFQYRVLKGLLFAFLGDMKESNRTITAALQLFDDASLEDHDIRELHLRAEALIRLPEEIRPNGALDLARQLLQHSLDSSKLRPRGEAMFWGVMGESYVAENQYALAIPHLEKSLSVHTEFVNQLNYVRALLRSGRHSAAKEAALAIDYARLSPGEQFDHTVGVAELAEASSDADLLTLAALRIDQLRPRYPVHVDIASQLRERLAQLRSSSVQLSQGFWRRLFAKYLVLQPNVFGFGVNINEIVENVTRSGSKE